MTPRFAQCELHWVRPTWTKPEYELRDGDRVVATLAWGRGMRASGQWGEAAPFHFDTHGFFKRQSVLMPDGVASPLATFNHRAQMLAFSDGRAYRWKKPRRFSQVRFWEDAAGTALVTFTPTHAATTLSLDPHLPESDLPLLALFGDYLTVLARHDEEAATTAAVVTIVAGH